MFYLILITVIGINIAPFFSAKNMLFFWNAQGLWAQFWILVCFSWSFFEKPRFESPRNVSLGLLHLWVGGLTWFSCMLVQYKGGYNVRALLPYFNFLCLVILYRMIVQYLNIKQIHTVYVFLRYSIIATLILSGLQFLGLSQFFQLIHPNYQGDGGQFVNNLVSGFIGNGTHLSGFLAMCIPLFLYEKKRENVIALILLGIILLLSGQTKGDIPISGIIVAVGIFLFYLWNINKRFFSGTVLLFIIASVFVWIYTPRHSLQLLFHPNGRYGWWKDFLVASKGTFLTGSGYGSVFWTGVKTKYPMHLHNEYIQFLVEGGLIGLILILNVAWEFLRTSHSKMGLMYKAMFFGFLISSMFTYPMHLWLPASYACVSYAVVVAMKERENVSNS